MPENHFQSDGYINKQIFFTSIEHEAPKTTTLVGSYTNNESKTATPLCVPVFLLLPAIEIGPIEEYPHTLGQLHNDLERRGSGIINSLKASITSLVTEEGIEGKKKGKEFVLLFLGIPRNKNGNMERIETHGFIIDSEICTLGELLSVLVKDPDKNIWYRDPLAPPGNENWKSLPIEPVNVRCYPTKKEIRRYSGLNPDNEGPIGIIAGVGALGGLLAQIWKRECWGEWTYVDNDIVQAHNIVRHISSRNGHRLPEIRGC